MVSGSSPATPICGPIHNGFSAFCLPHPSVALSTMVSRLFACHTHLWPYPRWFLGCLPATPICGPIHNGFSAFCLPHPSVALSTMVSRLFACHTHLWPYPQWFCYTFLRLSLALSTITLRRSLSPFFATLGSSFSSSRVLLSPRSVLFIRVLLLAHISSFNPGRPRLPSSHCWACYIW
jgi:hypothetical protein